MTSLLLQMDEIVRNTDCVKISYNGSMLLLYNDVLYQIARTNDNFNCNVVACDVTDVKKTIYGLLYVTKSADVYSLCLTNEGKGSVTCCLGEYSRFW